MNKRPNILYIMSDDHGSNAISAYKSRLASVFQTPNIDRIANEGALLNNVFCTNAICTPSRATILTGKYCHKLGVLTLADEMSPDLLTYPMMMQNSGYQTAVVGKWHVHCEVKGFDYYDVLPGQGYYFNPYFWDKETDWGEIENIHRKDQGKQHIGYVTDIITEKCLNWLEKRDKDKPFMLMCHHKAPHDDFEYHPRYEHIFDGVEIPEPDSLWEDKSHRSIGSMEYGSTVSEKNKKRNAVKRMSEPDYPTGVLDTRGLDETGRTKAAYQKMLKDYLRTVKAVDDSVGELLSYLEQEGILEDTIVIYTSDQGMFLGEHDYIDKRWIYDEALRMPFMIRYPKEIEPGSVINEIISNVDFAPTLLEYTGIQKDIEMQGRSFRGVINGNTPKDWSNKLYYRYWMHLAHHDNPAHYGIRTLDYKLIFFYGLPLDAKHALPEPTPAAWELYDLKKDPYEMKNVYNDPAYKEIIKDLKQQLIQIKNEVGDEDDKYPELMDRYNALESIG